MKPWDMTIGQPFLLGAPSARLYNITINTQVGKEGLEQPGGGMARWDTMMKLCKICNGGGEYERQGYGNWVAHFDKPNTLHTSTI